MLIDCDRCRAAPGACRDCVVTHLPSPAAPVRRPGDAPGPLATRATVTGPATLGAPVSLDAGEWRAVRVMVDAGLLAPLRVVAHRDGDAYHTERPSLSRPVHWRSPQRDDTPAPAPRARQRRRTA